MIFPRILVDLLDLGLRYFAGKATAHSLSASVDVKHHPYRVLPIQAKEKLEHMYHELHGGEVIIQEYNVVEGRAFQPRLGFLDRQAVIGSAFGAPRHDAGF